MSCFLNTKAQSKSRSSPESIWAKLMRPFRASNASQASTSTTSTSESGDLPQQQDLEPIENNVYDLVIDSLDFQPIKFDFTELQTEVNALKADFAREIGHSLALKLIDIVSELCDPDQDESSTCLPKVEEIDPWRWMTREEDFRKVTDNNPQLLPQGINSVEDITLIAANIHAIYQDKTHMRSSPEQLYLELKSFKEKGYMEALQKVDAELYDFLSLSELFGDQFVAGPRILHLTAHMFLRARMDIGRERFPSTWLDRWQNAETWFRTVLNSFRERIFERMQHIALDLDKEFNLIEEFCWRTKPDPMEAYPWEKIVHLFGEVEKSGLLTPQIRRKFILSCTLLDCALEIRDKYIPRHIAQL